MKRRFNYTGRKKITREYVSINLIRDQLGRVTAFNASINLNGLNLPTDAKVYVETYRRYELKRFEFGTVGNLLPPPHTLLTDFTYTENLKFRVLVVDSRVDGKILAYADRIIPEAPPDKKAILPVDFRDLGQQIWSVEFTGDEGAPQLLINNRISNIQNMAKSDPRFIMDVYPSALREVLIYMIFIEGVDSATDSSVDWHRDWLEFSRMLFPEGPPQEIYKPAEDGNFEVKKDWLEWIERVAAEFCSQRSEWRDYIQIVEGGET